MSLCDLNCCDLKWLQTKFDAINKKISDNQKIQDKINANIFKLLKESGIDVEALLKNYYALNEDDYTKTLTSEDDINTLEPGTYKIVKTDMPQNAPSGIVSSQYDGTLIQSNSYALLFADGFGKYYRTKTSEDSWTEWNKIAFMSDVPSLTGYATQDWVNQQIQDITGGSVTADWVKSNFFAINFNLYNLIQENDDLNNYTTPGIYTCKSNAISKTILNNPTKEAFTLITINSIKSNNYFQFYMRFIGHSIYIRESYDNEWTNWVKIATTDDIPSLNEYATKSWVQSQNYLTEIPDEYATDTEVSQAIAAALVGYATQAWVNEQISEITGGAVTSEVVSQMISDAIVGYATQSWVNGRGYQTATQVSAAIAAAIAGYATQNWVKSNFLSLEKDLYTDIQENDDLNNYRNPGNYLCISGTITNTLKNTPKGIQYSFKLVVEEIGGGTYFVQKITEMGTGNIFIRTCSGGSFTEWIMNGMISVFNTFSQLKITNLPCTTLDVYKAMPENSIAILGTDTTAGISDLPTSTGVLEITKLSSDYRYKITFYKSSGGVTPPSKDIWLATVNNGLTQLTWEKVALMTDIPSLSGYASQEWVQQQGYQTVQQVNSLIKNATTDMLTQEDLDTFNYATENWVLQTALTGYATQNWVNTKLNDYLPKTQQMSLTTQGTYYGLQYQWARYGQVVEVFLVGNLTQEISNQLISDFCPANPMRTLQTVIPGYDDTKHYAEFNNDGLKLMGSYQNELYINCHFTYLTNE